MLYSSYQQKKTESSVACNVSFFIEGMHEKKHSKKEVINIHPDMGIHLKIGRHALKISHYLIINLEVVSAYLHARMYTT